VDSIKVVKGILVVWKFKEVYVGVEKDIGFRVKLGKGMKMRVKPSVKRVNLLGICDIISRGGGSINIAKYNFFTMNGGFDG
jgi:hypothetical protein